MNKSLLGSSELHAYEMLILFINCKQPLLKQTWLWFFDCNGFSKVKVVQSRPCCFIYTWNITLHKTWPQNIACSTSKFSWGTHCLYYSSHVEFVPCLGIITLAFFKLSKASMREISNSRVRFHEKSIPEFAIRIGMMWAFSCRYYYFILT